jgi:GNAT superfamily N-acetyltransferase
MRRILENMAASIPVGLLLFLPVLGGLHSLYEWSHADVVANDAILQSKASWLNPQWFAIRAVIYFALWSIWSLALLRNSRNQDSNADLKYMHNNSRWSAPGLLVTTLSVSLAAFDWSMSLDPHWYSTIFGLYVFAGGAWAMFATWTLICIGFRNQGILAHTIRIDHFHDLGKWMFALTVFWAYIAFSQYLLIWYANIPEETIWYVHRLEGSWKWWSLAVLFGHFIVPFLVLVLRRNKRNLTVLTAAAIWFLTFHFVDAYFQVMPTFQKHGFALHWLDFACLAAPASVYALLFWMHTKASNLLPTGDPRFELGINFHQV